MLRPEPKHHQYLDQYKILKTKTIGKLSQTIKTIEPMSMVFLYFCKVISHSRLSLAKIRPKHKKDAYPKY